MNYSFHPAAEAEFRESEPLKSHRNQIFEDCPFTGFHCLSFTVKSLMVFRFCHLQEKAKRVRGIIYPNNLWTFNTVADRTGMPF